MDSKRANASGNGTPQSQRVFLGLVCALVIGIFAWSANSGVLESTSPRAEDAYYNLLVQGFRAGQFNVNREASPGLAKLANPYDPAANAPFIWDKEHLSYEMSYYKGKLYLYFGVTPALVLFWPYAALTGHYLAMKDAVVIFFALGFLIAAGLLYAIWRRYFPGTSKWVAASGIVALGLCTGILETLSSCDVYEVARSCGFMFTMFALAAIWRAWHAPERQVKWLLLASLAYGLAIGARPSLLYGAIILLVPVVRAWHGATEGNSPWRAASVLLAVGVPITLIGLGLMLYNYARFDNPFEFGWHYQLTSYQNNSYRQFSLDYLWFNFRFYFLETFGWNAHFPFLQIPRLPPEPAGYCGIGAPFGGILINYPVTWLALASPLALRGRPEREISNLGWFMATALILFLASGVTMCVFVFGSSLYELDFLPALMLLAVVGIFGLERRVFTGSPFRRRMVRCGWCLLLAYSVLFNALAGVKAQVGANYIAGNSLFHQGFMDEAAEHFEKALALEPSSATAHLGLGAVYFKTGLTMEATNELQKALQINPNYAEAEYDMGCCLVFAGKPNEAFPHFQKALKIQPDFVKGDFSVQSNYLAWLLATDPDSGKRDGALAVELAEGACQGTHYQVTIMVGTLAAAYAEAGRFDDAIATANKAIALAQRHGEKDLLEKNRQLLQLYLAHKAYHETATDQPAS